PPLLNPTSPPFPTRRSSDLPCRNAPLLRLGRHNPVALNDLQHLVILVRMRPGASARAKIHRQQFHLGTVLGADKLLCMDFTVEIDRKSTRLNSSHGSISYAV